MLLEATTTAVAAAAAGDGNRLATIIADSDPIIKATLLILVFFSVVSWAIILLKWAQLRTARGKIRRFLQQFWQAKTIDALLQRGKVASGPAASIFKSAIAPLREPGITELALRVQREAERATDDEVEHLEHYVPFLATTASVTPFIGLFGTVWGILNAFFEIKLAGSSGIEVIGPRIAEALFATAVGLAAAIPAVVFYNVFVNRIRHLSRQIEQFADDLTHRIAMEYLHAKSA
ncbi:MAG: MotA/TolQ/ExbB proton channel family protein [Deltaproteobacteria bacterium]|nr:MotA/TolQ/ExbB proton channel family protein [Deltaproteobacteria bacterium]